MGRWANEDANSISVKNAFLKMFLLRWSRLCFYIFASVIVVLNHKLGVLRVLTKTHLNLSFKVTENIRVVPNDLDYLVTLSFYESLVFHWDRPFLVVKLNPNFVNSVSLFLVLSIRRAKKSIEKKLFFSSMERMQKIKLYSYPLSSNG